MKYKSKERHRWRSQSTVKRTPEQNLKGQRGPEWQLEDVLHFCRFGGKRAHANDFFFEGGGSE